MLNGPPGVSLYYQRLASGRYSPMVEVTWEAPSGDLRRGVSSALEHTLRGALLRALEKAARALASGDVRRTSLFEESSPFSNLTATGRRALGLFPNSESGKNAEPSPQNALDSEDDLHELIARLYRSVLPSIEAAYHLRVLHGAPGLRIEGTGNASSRPSSGKDASDVQLNGEWPRLDDSPRARSEASISEYGLGGALQEVLEMLAREVGEGRIDVEAALLGNSPLRALNISEERLGKLTGEDLQEMLFDKLYPPLCALQRIEGGPEKRREDRCIGTHLSIKSGADARKAL